MKKLSLLLIFLAFSITGKSQITAQMKADLGAEQTKMFTCFSNGDQEAFRRLAGEDYITINADGTYMKKAEAINMIDKFKGSTYEITQQETRFYENIAITTGHVKFHVKSILAADVYFTQTWVRRDDRWLFIGWQGTMTGQPANYPVYGILFVLFLLVGITLYIGSVRRRKNKG